ncbi:hypothetical protein NDU88_011737 [Pleurodeles waltl]|uniref:Uncharacterized protein n=1 Tax=Pleurodeles waltl TaxID=8319 RepID=A0AAV7S537_PLEWA|nr:hypothetical protein NDU88_011737 [Pleurodeles waltl]
MLDGSCGCCSLLTWAVHGHTGLYAQGCLYIKGPPSVAMCWPLASLQRAHRADVARKVNIASGIFVEAGTSSLGERRMPFHQWSAAGPIIEPVATVRITGCSLHWYCNASGKESAGSLGPLPVIRGG